jgi:hypothetical protein
MNKPYIKNNEMSVVTHFEENNGQLATTIEGWNYLILELISDLD